MRGIQKYKSHLGNKGLRNGKGVWSLIKNDQQYAISLRHRTNVMLKDRYRVLSKKDTTVTTKSTFQKPK